MKLPRRARAADLYVSPWFQKARAYAQRADRWYILSAKHGLVDPASAIAPYESTLNTMRKADRDRWAERVFTSLCEVTAPGDEITVLAGDRYREKLVPLLEARGNAVDVPMAGMSIGRQLQWLTRAGRTAERTSCLDRFYRILGELERAVGGRRVLGECTGRMQWPARGVYFIFEPGEVRASDPSTPRVVRVGTHAVSRGSRATLWSRLRAHKGTASGGGNHRSSIFRLHVGAALIRQANGRLSSPQWGKGSSAPRHIRQRELPMEQRVSEHIGQMSVLWLAVRDEARPASDRAFLERNAIALLATEGRTADAPSSGWLGRHSTRSEIRDSGLWNLDHLDGELDERFFQVLEDHVEETSHLYLS